MVIIVFLFFFLIGAGRDGVAVEQDFVARQVRLELADLVVGVEQVLLVFKPRLLEGELLGGDLYWCMPD